MEELTYENMLAFVKRYFDMLPSITGPESAPMVREFFSPGYKICMADLWLTGHPTGEQIIKQEILDREGWVNHLTGHAGEYRARCIYEPWPLFILIDERQKQAIWRIKEQKLDPKTMKPLVEWYMVGGFGLTLDANKTIKFNEEFIIGYPDEFIKG